MSRFHPQWASVSPDDLIWCDDAVCRGNFRDWARLTRKLVLKNQQRENPPHTFTRALAREAIQEFSASDVWTEPELLPPTQTAFPLHPSLGAAALPRLLRQEPSDPGPVQVGPRDTAGPRRTEPPCPGPGDSRSPTGRSTLGHEDQGP